MADESFEFYAPDITVDWDRSIFVDTIISDELVQKLAPSILKLRQSSKTPITIGIDSPGGSIASLEALLGLLQGPNQEGERGQFIAVVTHRAYSAAADLVAFSDYSLAYQHSEILFHDVRYAEIGDVTPGKARLTARALREANATFSLKLANRIVRRLIWNYIDFRSNFKDLGAAYPETTASYSRQLAPYINRADSQIDLLGFAIALFAHLTKKNEGLIDRAVDHLDRYIQFEKLESLVPIRRAKGSRKPGLLDGFEHLCAEFRRASGIKSDESFRLADTTVADLKLLFAACARRLADSKTTDPNLGQLIDQIDQDFYNIRSMTDPKHVNAISDLMLKSKFMFFGKDRMAQWDAAKTKEDRAKITQIVYPDAQAFWHFATLVSAALCEGDHVLGPNDAQILGVLDEVAGGGPIQSKREFRIAQAKKKKTAASGPAAAPAGPG